MTIKQFRFIRKQLIEDGLNKKYIKRIYADTRVELDYEGVGNYLGYKESKLDYDTFLHPKLIRMANEYLDNYSTVFSRAQKKYSVNKRVIAAIILVETKFGKYLGKRPVFNTLSTMASFSDKGVRWLFWTRAGEKMNQPKQRFYDKADKKAPWAYNELKEFLKYTFEEKIDPLKIPGSFAGAMGICQFMPSNIRPFGEDGNNDGMVNLFDHTDAIMSVAKYLKGHGWEPEMSNAEAHNVILRYNSSNYYAKTVLNIASRLTD